MDSQYPGSILVLQFSQKVNSEARVTSVVPTGLRGFGASIPSDESLGYYHKSLRDLTRQGFLGELLFSSFLSFGHSYPSDVKHKKPEGTLSNIGSPLPLFLRFPVLRIQLAGASCATRYADSGEGVDEERFDMHAVESVPHPSI